MCLKEWRLTTLDTKRLSDDQSFLKYLMVMKILLEILRKVEGWRTRSYINKGAV